MVTVVDAAAFWLLYHRFKRLVNGHFRDFPAIFDYGNYGVSWVPPVAVPWARLRLEAVVELRMCVYADTR